MHNQLKRGVLAGLKMLQVAMSICGYILQFGSYVYYTRGGRHAGLGAQGCIEHMWVYDLGIFLCI